MKAEKLRRIIPLVILLIAVGAAIFYLSRISGAEAKALTASGTVEATEVMVAPESAGRVAEVFFDEGDTVVAGEVLFTLEDDVLQAQRRRAMTTLRTAQAQLDLLLAGTTPEEIAAAEADVAAAQGSAATAETALAQAQISADSARVVQRTESSVAAAEAALAQAKAAADVTRADLTRAQAELARLEAGARPEEIAMYQFLVNKAQSEFLYLENIHFDMYIDKDVSGGPEERARYQRESARNARDAAQAQLDLVKAGATDEEIAAAAAVVQAARAQVALAEAGVAAAEATLSQAQGTPETTQDQVALADAGVAAALAQVRIAEGQLAQAEAQRDRLVAGGTDEEIAVLESQIDQALAEIDLIDVRLEQLVVRAAVPGVIMTRDIQPGEFVQPGAIAMTLGQLDNLTITIYVPEDRYGQILLGEKVPVTVDSFPDQHFEAVVTRVADRAEFTPRNVQTEEGRRTTVFAVTLSVTDPEGKLKPGMPADVDFG